MGVPIKRGQLIRSYRRIAKDCAYKVGYRLKKPSLSTIKSICEELTKDARTERRSEHCGTLFTICNYNELQPLKKRETNGEATDDRTVPEHNKNDKNEKHIFTSLQSQKDGIPHDEILDIYHTILSELPRVRIFTKKRKAMLKARWHEDIKRQNLDWWQGYFKYVRESEFLMGNNGKWQANFEWLINASNLVKVTEGQYHR